MPWEQPNWAAVWMAFSSVWWGNKKIPPDPPQETPNLLHKYTSEFSLLWLIQPNNKFYLKEITFLVTAYTKKKSQYMGLFQGLKPHSYQLSSEWWCSASWKLGEIPCVKSLPKSQPSLTGATAMFLSFQVILVLGGCITQQGIRAQQTMHFQEDALFHLSTLQESH